MNPRTQLNAIARIAHDLATRWDDYETTEAALGNDPLPGTSGAGVGGGDTPDPTYAANLARNRWNEICLEIAEAHGHLLAVERRIAPVVAEHPENARLVDAAVRGARCSEPACDDLAVKDGRCWRDWQAKRNAG